MKVYRRMNAVLLRRRRGVTLVEMLVTLAVLLLMMALVVQIFQAATGAMNAAQVYQELDDKLRRFDSTVRSDLAGATARFTPPLDPQENRGYFEYGENEFADNDGEDTDDYIRFTAKAPVGRPFTGRMWPKPPRVQFASGGTVGQAQTYSDVIGQADGPITVTSEYAEIIYFLRNGNLYRRVLLVAPELQSRIIPSYSEGTNWNIGYFLESSTGGPTLPFGFFPAALGGVKVSWQGVNDLSARPAARGLPTLNGANNSVVLNTLGDLTDRHNRFAMPRFADDFVNLAGALVADGIPDDRDGDNVPDFYPTLYPNLINNAATVGLWNAFDPTTTAMALVASQQRNSLGFPYVFRGAYTQAQLLGDFSAGWIHAPAPTAVDPADPSVTYRFDVDPANYLRFLNHNPLDLGDNLPTPQSASQNADNLQTFFGFPTWRETLAPEWNDPTFQVNLDPTANAPHPHGLPPHDIGQGELTAGYLQNTTLAPASNLLPPMTADWRGVRGAQPFSDGRGTTSTAGFFSGDPANSLWSNASWEDDLILTNVRSFDVKAFDPALADYADLGWGDDLRVARPATSVGANVSLGTNQTIPYLYGSYDAISGGYAANAYAAINGSLYSLIDQTFAHEGRMPPRLDDFRFDAQYGAVVAGTYSTVPAYTGNVGDDNANVIRLRRVWDSWSTTYSKAPATGVQPGSSTAAGFPYGPPYTPPIYPSYPPPYPAPLRGIQIQVRVTDPTSQRIKVLTIRQDFTDKL